MTRPVRTSQKSYGRLSLAVALLLLAGAAFLLEPHNFAIRSLSVLAILGSVQLTRTSRVRPQDRGPVPANSGWIDLTAPKRPSRAMWLVGIALIPLAGFSVRFLYLDELHGAHEAWPVYLFAGVGLACAGVWSAIVAKLLY